MSSNNEQLDNLANRLRTSLAAHCGEQTAARLEQAIAACRHAHEPQRRKHGAPYAVHPLRVTLLLVEDFCEREHDTLCAALLHDVLEDAADRFSAEEIRASFGPGVLSLVETLTSPTEQEFPDKQERNRRKAAKVTAGPPAARLIKLADRIDNLRDAVNVGGETGQKFRERYFEESLRYYLPLAIALQRPDVLASFNATLHQVKERLMNAYPGPRVAAAAGVKLDLTRMRLPHNLDLHYRLLLDGAVDLMAAVEAGEVVNVDEGWQVGHYWLRHPELAPQYCRAIQQAIENVPEFCNRLVRNRFQKILWIGIGGSGLGPQLLYDAWRRAETPIRMFFLDNTDPAGFRRVFDDLNAAGGLQDTLTVVVSKSGRTKETNNGKDAAKQEYCNADVAFEERAVAITVEDSDLHREAAGWLKRLPLWNWVGGRTSLFSSVGLLPAAAMGMDGGKFLAGARAMDDATRDRPLQNNLALLLAATWYHAVEVEQRANLVILPYDDRLCMLSKYLQQLLMESLGKNGKGITVLGNKGSTDQHSYVQQLRDGPANYFAIFIRVLKVGQDWVVRAAEADKAWTQLTAGDYLAAFQEGTAQALSEAGRPSLRITIDELTEYSLGALIALFERTVGYYAAMLGINAYDQPGVESGKAAADHIIDLQGKIIQLLMSKRGGPMKVMEIAKLFKASPEFVDDWLWRLAKNGRFGVRLECDSPFESQRSYYCALP